MVTLAPNGFALGEFVTKVERREKFIAVVGLPRSGTTLLTALLDRHSSICLYYEPWNASPKNRPAVPRDLAEFRASMNARFGAEESAKRNVTGFKETTTNAETTAWAIETLDALSASCDIQAIWIQRNPIHCFLSKIDGAKKWWGYPDARFSKTSLEQFLSESEKSYDVLADLLARHGGLVVRYEGLAREPLETLADVMQALGKEFELTQLDYYTLASGKFARHKIMGDPGLVESPAPVTRASIERRDGEARNHHSVIEEVFAQPRFDRLIAEFERYARLPAVTRVQPDFEP